jgi:serine/threonine-protein kinase
VNDDRWSIVQLLLGAALAREPQERAAFLRQVCGEDEALRRDVESLVAHAASGAGLLSTPALRREVEALLDAPASADGVFAQPAMAAAAQPASDPAAKVLTGRRLGVYQLKDRIGVGGMGEVYRARDTNLGRDVAIKILPRAATSDPDRLARFEREARVLAALNHPNIATIHGFEKTNGVRALVMELVEGETLADRIARGSVPIDEALLIAKQIAEALEAAHEQGIVHRDLKPANVKIRPDGTVKVLDFGLAKALDTVADPSAASHSPTVTSPAMTRAGVILGTAAYMAPEQARGDAADRRADIWAFGCVLFEMLTGRRPFEGATISDTLAAILRAEPEWRHLPPRLHPGLRRLLERCLEKKVRDRYQGIADARVDIQYTLSTPPGGSLAAPVPHAALVVPRRFLPWLGGIVALMAAVVGVATWTIKPTASRVNARLTYPLPPDQLFVTGALPLLAVAPDGSSVVYSANNQLFLRPMNELEGRPIRGTEGRPSAPFLSPNGRWVGYFDGRDEGLKKIDIEGGTAVVLDRATIVRGASWGVDDTVLYAKDDGIWRVSANGGRPERIIPIQEGWVHGPQMLPDGHTVLFTHLRVQSGNSWEGAEIVARDLDNGQQQTLLIGEDARYVPTGHLVYAIDTTLMAVPFDARANQVTGGPVPVVEGVRREVFLAGNTATANYGFTNTGILAYLHGSTTRFPVIRQDLVMVDRQGNAQPLSDQRRDYSRPRISPDGKRIAVEVFDGRERHIWIVSVETGVWTQLTFEGIVNDYPVWTRDGQSVIFDSYRKDGPGLYRKHVGGSTDAEFLGVHGVLTPTDISAQGTLVFSLGVQTAERALWTLPLEHGKPTAILDTPAQEQHAMFSPDGKWLAYASDEESRTQEIYIRPYPIVQGSQRRVSEGGGAGPVWAPDGSELYYRGGRAIMVVSTPLGPGFVPGRPRALFSSERFRFSGNASAFDIHPDGKRFVMVTQGDQPPPVPNRINVVLNWFEELNRLVPAK